MGSLQRQLADAPSLPGSIDKNAKPQRIECGKRFVTDIEIIAIADTLGVSLDALLRRRIYCNKNSRKKALTRSSIYVRITYALWRDTEVVITERS